MTTFYKKEGSNFIPVAEYNSELLHSLKYGSYLITITSGSQNLKKLDSNAYLPMLAAGINAQEAIAQAIYIASRARPSMPPLTKEQKVAWDNLASAFGSDLMSIQYNSASDIADAGIAILVEEATKLLSNPIVQAAYDQFMLVCELSKDHINDNSN